MASGELPAPAHGIDDAHRFMRSAPPATVPLRTKLLYGTGSVAEGVKNTTFTTFLLFYYTQVAGLSGSLAGAAIFVALVVDAITDPLIGNFSDHFRSRWGRRHPFMYAAAAPMALSFVLLFQPPADLSQAGLFFWMLTFAVGVRFAMTFYLIPSAALVPEMTQNYDERTTLLSFRVLFGWIGGLVAAQAGYLYFFAPSAEFADGRLDPSAYSAYAIAGACAIALAIVACSLGTHHLIPKLRPPTGEGFSLAGFVRDIRQAFRIRSYVVLILSILTITTATGFTDVTNLYVNTYFWEFTTAEIAILVFGALVGMALGFMLTGIVSRWSDKRSAVITCIAAITFVGPAPVVLRLFDLMPANGHPALLPILVLYTLFIVYVAVTVQILAGSMIADTIDENELASGQRQEGLFNASIGLTAKATSGLGGFVAGVLLDVIDFPTGVGAQNVDPADVFALGVGVGPVIFVFWVIALLILTRYRLSREDHGRIIAAINARREASAAAD